MLQRGRYPITPPRCSWFLQRNAFHQGKGKLRRQSIHKLTEQLLQVRRRRDTRHWLAVKVLIPNLYETLVLP